MDMAGQLDGVTLAFTGDFRTGATGQNISYADSLSARDRHKA